MLKNIIPQYKIVAPIGGFGNHIRWLVLLDDKFKISKPIVWNQQTFDNLKGSSWPDFDQFDCMPDWVKQECKHLLGQEGWISLNENIQDKVNFILEQVYDQSRTWSNWLSKEWRYRESLNTIIFFDHDDSIADKNTCLKVIIEPELAYKCYLKFNSNLNHESKEDFLNGIAKKNQKASDYNHIIDSTGLYSPNLDKNLYTNLCNVFDLKNNYEHACIVHKRWYELHKKSESDIVEHFQKMYL